MEMLYTLFEGVTSFALVGYGIMLCFVFIAITHWVAYLLDFRRELCQWQELHRELGTLLQRLTHGTVSGDQRKEQLRRYLDPMRKRSLMHYPLLSVFGWLVQDGRVRRDPVVVLERFDTEVAGYFDSAFKECNRNKELAPVFGQMFTVIGIIIASSHFAAGATQADLLGDVGVALGTTALGTFTVILERSLIGSFLQPRALALRNEGQRLLLDALEVLGSRSKATSLPACLPVPTRKGVTQ